MRNIKYIDDMEKWEQEFVFFQPVKVRFSDTDLFGHLNNTVPFVYFEEARIEFFKSLGMMKNWVNEVSESMIVTADLQCDFLSQVYFDENLKIYVKAQTIGNSSVDLHYMAKKENGEICFVGRGAIVHISKKTGKGIPWSEGMRKALIQQIPVHA